MPYYGDGGPYYYGGSGGGGSYANHSSLMTSIGRYYSPIAARYSPHLSTISESPSYVVRRRHGPISGISSSSSSTASTGVPFARPRRIIDTADIDVTKPPRSYGQDSSRQQQQQQQQRHRLLRRDRPTVKIRSQALKDNPALREYNEKHEKTVGELLVEKFLIKDKQQQPQQSERKMRLYHQASLLRPDASLESSRAKDEEGEEEEEEEEEDLLAAMRRRITRRMTRRRSSADVIPLNPEQIEREAALLAAQAEALDSLVAQEQAEIEVEVRRGTFAKRQPAMRLPCSEISELSESEPEEEEQDEDDSSKSGSHRPHLPKKKRRKRAPAAAAAVAIELAASAPSEDEDDEILLEIPESVIEEEEGFEWDDREKCDDLRDIVPSNGEVVIKINDVFAGKSKDRSAKTNIDALPDSKLPKVIIASNGRLEPDAKALRNEIRNDVKIESAAAAATTSSLKNKISLDIIDAKIQETRKEIKDLICKEKRFPELKRREKMLKLDEAKVIIDVTDTKETTIASTNKSASDQISQSKTDNLFNEVKVEDRSLLLPLKEMKDASSVAVAAVKTVDADVKMAKLETTKEDEIITKEKKNEITATEKKNEITMKDKTYHQSTTKDKKDEVVIKEKMNEAGMMMIDKKKDEAVVTKKKKENDEATSKFEKIVARTMGKSDEIIKSNEKKNDISKKDKKIEATVNLKKDDSAEIDKIEVKKDEKVATKEKKISKAKAKPKNSESDGKKEQQQQQSLLKAEPSLKRTESAAQADSLNDELVPRFKIEACNSVGDFSTLYVKAANTEPSSSSPRMIEQFRESVRLPAPRSPTNYAKLPHNNNNNRSSSSSSSSVEAAVVLPARKPYVLDTARNSVYLALRPNQPTLAEEVPAAAAEAGPPTPGDSSINDINDVQRSIAKMRKETSATSETSIGGGGGGGSRPANYVENRSITGGDVLINAEQRSGLLSDSEPVKRLEKSEEQRSRIESCEIAAAVNLSSAKVKARARAKEDFVAWWDETPEPAQDHKTDDGNNKLVLLKSDRDDDDDDASAATGNSKLLGREIKKSEVTSFKAKKKVELDQIEDKSKTRVEQVTLDAKKPAGPAAATVVNKYKAVEKKENALSIVDVKGIDIQDKSKLAATPGKKIEIKSLNDKPVEKPTIPKEESPSVLKETNKSFVIIEKSKNKPDVKIAEGKESLPKVEPEGIKIQLVEIKGKSSDKKSDKNEKPAKLSSGVKQTKAVKEEEEEEKPRSTELQEKKKKKKKAPPKLSSEKESTTPSAAAASAESALSCAKDKSSSSLDLAPSSSRPEKKPHSESTRHERQPLANIPEEPVQITSPPIIDKPKEIPAQKNKSSVNAIVSDESTILPYNHHHRIPGLKRDKDERKRRVDAAAIMKIEKRILEESDSPHGIRASVMPESQIVELARKREEEEEALAAAATATALATSQPMESGTAQQQQQPAAEIDFWSEIQKAPKRNAENITAPSAAAITAPAVKGAQLQRKSLRLDLSRVVDSEKRSEDELATPLVPNQLDESTPLVSQPATPLVDNLSRVPVSNLQRSTSTTTILAAAAGAAAAAREEEELVEDTDERTSTVKKISKWSNCVNLSSLNDAEGDATPMASKEVSPQVSMSSTTTKKKMIVKKKKKSLTGGGGSSSNKKSSEKGGESVKLQSSGTGKSKKTKGLSGCCAGPKKKQAAGSTTTLPVAASPQTSLLKAPLSAAGSPRNSPSQRPADLNKLFYTTPAILLTATPRDLRKVRRAKVKRKKPPATRTPSLSSDSTGSTRSTATTTNSTEEPASSSGASNCEDDLDLHKQRLASTRSNDSGFDGSPRLSNCDMVCHKKCEKLTGNLCGLNQKLVAEALQALKKGPSYMRTGRKSFVRRRLRPYGYVDLQATTPSQSSENPRNADSEHFHHSGRITPPATNLPRFKKYEVTDFNFLKVLGKGSFGKVLLAELRGTECVYAVKCLKKDVVLEDDDVECTLIERKVLTLATRHPYLCHLFCTFQTESHLFFVMEYLNGGDLMFHIQKSGRFSEPRARFYAAEIWSGLIFLHKKGIVYRDLKLDNVLLDFEGHIRIADFGMCKLQIFLDRTADTFCGTPDYMAPEIIKGLKYNQAVDWWSYGVLLYEMLTGQSPFSGCDEDELFWSICNERPFIPRYLSQGATEILVCLLEKDAGKRIPGHEIVCHSFFNTIAWDKLERRTLEPPFKPAVEHTLDTRYFDTAFTTERPRLTPVPNQILTSMDQSVFRGFSYTNPNATD